MVKGLFLGNSTHLPRLDNAQAAAGYSNAIPPQNSISAEQPNAAESTTSESLIVAR